jgi:hypothetical protein
MKTGSIPLMKWQRAAREASSEMRDIEFRSADHVRRHTRFRNLQPHPGLIASSAIGSPDVVQAFR